MCEKILNKLRRKYCYICFVARAALFYDSFPIRQLSTLQDNMRKISDHTMIFSYYINIYEQFPIHSIASQQSSVTVQYKTEIK